MAKTVTKAIKAPASKTAVTATKKAAQKAAAKGIREAAPVVVSPETVARHSFIVITDATGPTYFLRGTVWSQDRERATVHADEAAALAAIKAASQFNPRAAKKARVVAADAPLVETAPVAIAAGKLSTKEFAKAALAALRGEPVETAPAAKPTTKGVGEIARKHAAVAADFVAKLDAADKADAKPAKAAKVVKAAKPAKPLPASAVEAAAAIKAKDDRKRARNEAKAEKPAKAPATGLTGVKAKILAMMQAKDGASAAEICKALGWVQCGATISRVIKAATALKLATVRKERVEGVVRYIATV